jgi:hypothetical protein
MSQPQTTKELIDQLKAQGMTFEQIIIELQKRGIKLGGQK